MEHTPTRGQAHVNQLTVSTKTLALETNERHGNLRSRRIFLSKSCKYQLNFFQFLMEKKILKL